MKNIELTGNVNYSAQIFTVPEVRKALNSDRLYTFDFGGSSVVVDDSWIDRAGTKAVIFFPESQLSDTLAASANLYRHSDKNSDETVKGYLEDNRRVRAIRLRGNPSNALVLPIETVASAFKATPEDFDGVTSFDHIGGVEVVRKYEIPVNRGSVQASSVKKAFKRVTTTQLPEHYDTSNYFRFSGNIPDDARITVTQKLHGCFPASTPVLMWDGTQKKISEVKVGDVVVGYEDGITVPSLVQAAFTTGETDSWLRTKVENPVIGDAPTVTSTDNHKILAVGRGWVRARKLREDDRVMYVKHQPALTAEKEEILTGLMLGDGSVAGPKRNEVQFAHKADHEEYVRFIHDALGNIAGPGEFSRKVSGYGTPMVGSRTSRLEAVRKHVRKFDGNVIPYNLTLTDLTLAVWYMDDGSRAHSSTQQDRANFAVCAYDDENAQRLVNAMVRYGFDTPKLYKDSTGFNRIRLNKDDAETLFLAIRKYVPESMQYKLPEYHRGFFEGVRTEDKVEPIVFPTDILGQEEVSVALGSGSRRFGRTKYDLTTSTGNFVANRIIVHNSSVRLGRVQMLRKLTWLDKVAQFFGVRVQQFEHDTVAGSRKVIKDVNNLSHDHYYSYDLWTDMLRVYEDLIPENFVLYGEIVGWTKDGSPIQRNYTYDVPKGEAELYVYRVAVVTDGEIVDLTWPEVERFCSVRGIKTVPTLYHNVSKNNFDVMILPTLIEKNYHKEVDPKCVPLSEGGPGVDEGFAVRVDTARGPQFYKGKNTSFLEHETKILDTGEADLESEQSEEQTV